MLRSFVLVLTVPPLVAAIGAACYWWRVRRRARLVAPEERADRLALKMLRERTRIFGFGLDGDDELLGHAEPQEVAFYLYFPTREGAERAAAHAATLAVETSVLRVSVEPAARGAAWLCRVTIQAEATETLIRQASAQLSRLARDCGGEFDGWEAAIPW